MVAYHYPPVGVSSGVHRTLKFSRYLGEFGWEPVVLTAVPHMYDRTSLCQIDDIPANVCVKRAWGLDAARHFAIAGHYPGWLAQPDRWSSWWLGGVWSGWRLIKKLRPRLIWSTYPIATAHLIALTLHKMTGIPLVADFRDSMVDDVYPYKGCKRRLFLSIERRVVNAAAKVIFTTQGSRRMYAERYPELPQDHWEVIANGYDESDFSRLVQREVGACKGGKLKLLHSGLLYPLERDPQNFFAAVAELKASGLASGEDIEIVLRAAGHEDLLSSLIEHYGISDMVTLAPPLDYNLAIQEMMEVDGLLIFQATNCNHQIPAKLYEYLRAGRPILAMTDPNGDTAALLRQVEGGIQTPLDSCDAIRLGLQEFIGRIRAGDAPVASKDVVGQYSRYAMTAKLAEVLNALI